MKYTYDEYQIMIDSAWSAFENTLKTWGITQEQITKFIYIVDCKDGYKTVDDALAEVVELED